VRALTKPHDPEPTQNAGKLFARRGLEGSIVMLNLLRFPEAGQRD
jgi:hypothetical protein